MLVISGNPHQRMSCCASRSVREDREPEIMPINHKHRPAQSGHQPADEKCGYAGRVLYKDKSWGCLQLEEKELYKLKNQGDNFDGRED